MNGDSRKTGKLTPDGKPDPSIFSTEYNREGIRVGTAIALMVRKSGKRPHGRKYGSGSSGALPRLTNDGATVAGKISKVKDFDANYEAATPEERTAIHFVQLPSLKLIAYGPGWSTCLLASPSMGRLNGVGTP